MDAPFEPGDQVEIMDGTFAGHRGKVIEILRHPRFGLVRVEIVIYGREVPVELAFSEIRPE
jgi:transcription antitermination factor NusG